jgi:SNF2 family DNA or RNA helicase
MSHLELPDDFEGLKAWIQNSEEKLEKDVSIGKSLSDELTTLNTEEQELKRKLKELETKKNSLTSTQRDLRVNARNSKAAIQNAKQRLQVVRKDAEMQSRFKEDAEFYDTITRGYQWREFAYSYQIEGAKRLAVAKRAILGDKRGLGKTLTSLIYADMVGAKKILIFAPKDVLENFQREIGHWTPHRKVHILSGMPKVQRDMFLAVLGASEECVILCNYEAWRKDKSLIKGLINVKFDTIIVDEAHNLKTKTTSNFLGVREIVYAVNQCNICGGTPEKYKDAVTQIYHDRCSVCLQEPEDFGDFCSVKNVVPMTGTKILNKPQDIWSLLHLISREDFPDEANFLRNYCEISPYTGRWSFTSGGESALMHKLGFRIVSRTPKSAGVKIPPQTVQFHKIDFDRGLYPNQWKVIEQIRRHSAILMAEDVKLDILGVLAELMRRRQAITWPAGIQVKDPHTKEILYTAPVTESIKIDKAMELSKEIIVYEDDRLVIFSEFKEALKELENRFNKEGISVVRYDGDLSNYNSQVAQLDFDGKTAPNHPKDQNCNSECINWGKPCFGFKYHVILCHYKKGGVGLNLNAARQMIILDREWNPGKEDQAQGRIDRLDNKHETVVHIIHVNGSIDEFLDSLHVEKSQMIEGFESTVGLEELKQALLDGNLM